MYKSKCNECGKVIEGYTQKQADYMMRQHILSKHENQVEFKRQR